MNGLDPCAYIRETYGIPIFIGQRVKFHFHVPSHILGATSQGGWITGASNHIHVILDGEHHARAFHPAWLVTYYNPDGTEMVSFGDTY